MTLCLPGFWKSQIRWPIMPTLSLIHILDEHGNLCVQADIKLTFTVQGPGYAAAVDNGNPEGMESLRGSCIHAFHGRAYVIIQSDALH